MTFWFQTMFPQSFDEEIHLKNFDFPSVTDTSLSISKRNYWFTRTDPLKAPKLQNWGGGGALKHMY